MSDLLSENGLISPDDLYYMLGGNERIRVLDATYGPVQGQSPFQAYLGCRIENAQFFDIDAVADQQAPLPHTLPSEEYFADCASSMGISNGDHVVIYDQSGSYMASTRAWWMFRTFGHEKVYILDGGLQAWIKQGFKTEEGPTAAPAPGAFTARLNTSLVISRDDLLANLKTKNIDVFDARPAERFHGMAPEPRPGMRAGHIPHSHSLPFGAVIDPQTRKFKPDDAIENILRDSGVSTDNAIAVSCGSGVTACTLAFALFKARRQNAAVYDGSWAEWGDEASGTPVEVSA